MAFVSQVATEEDRKIFDLSNVRTPWGSPIDVFTLTMDRERLAYLARIGEDREPPHDEEFVFWWQGKLAFFEVNMTEEHPPTRNGLVAVFRKLRLIGDLETQRDVVLGMIKEALSVWHSAGFDREVPVFLRLDKNTLI